MSLYPAVASGRLRLFLDSGFGTWDVLRLNWLGRRRGGLGPFRGPPR
jgi:hypothetical protein